MPQGQNETRAKVNYYAHTAVKADGKPEPDTAKWQLLSTHLRNVAELAAKRAEPLGLAAEARTAGLLHDLGKYAGRFQSRLHDNSIHGINHWAAGSAHAVETLKQLSVAFAVDGHHTGIPALDGNAGLKQTVNRRADPKTWKEWTGCLESIPELLDRQRQIDGIELPSLPRRAVNDRWPSGASVSSRTAESSQPITRPPSTRRWPTFSRASACATNEKQEAPSGLSARGRDKKAQLSALPQHRHKFEPMQSCFSTFSAPFPKPVMKLARVSYLRHHAQNRTWVWLPESVHAKGISCQVAEGELRTVRQGRKET